MEANYLEWGLLNGHTLIDRLTKTEMLLNRSSKEIKLRF